MKNILKKTCGFTLHIGLGKKAFVQKTAEDFAYLANDTSKDLFVMDLTQTTT